MGVLWSKTKQIAYLELGYTEGTNNWTKYAQALDKIKYFNSPKQNIAWCCTYIAYCMYFASGNKADTLATQYQPSNDNCGCGVKFNADYYKNKKAWYTTPKEGDIFFTKGYNHAGFVYKVNDDGTFITNEGNHNNKVDSISRKVSDMEGFGRPKYAAEPSPEPEKTVNINIKVNAPEGVKVNVNVE